MSQGRLQPVPQQPDLLTVDSLRVSFGRGIDEKAVVRSISFSLQPGRCLAIVGESGSGKSVTARALIGLAGRYANVHARQLSFDGTDLMGLNDRAWRRIRGNEIGFVFQDALVSLDPLRRIGKEIGEGLLLHGAVSSREELAQRVIALLKLVGVPDPETKAEQLPHQLSGGQRQRALIASALALDPRILIADEPTTALDVTVQAHVLSLLEETKTRGKALILISHDLAVVSRVADEILVMRGGEVVERGNAVQIFKDPGHPYTKQLLDAVPSGRPRGSRLSPSTIVRSPARQTQPAVQSPPKSCPILLEATSLVKRFKGPDGTLRAAVDGVSFELRSGETLGIVGESGSGKSTMARMVLALEEPDEGAVQFAGRPWTTLAERERRARRRSLSIIYQDPLGSFDPRWTVGRIISDSLSSDVETRRKRQERVIELLDLVGLSQALLDRRPLELSGGQRQRVAIARAIAPNPAVIVCDEPVSALDVSIQAQVLDLLCYLKDHLGVSYLFISHDLSVVRHISDRVIVMRRGRIVDSGATEEIFRNPQSEYTKSLIAAMPRLVRDHQIDHSATILEEGIA
ncbi:MULTISPECIES: ABC transporter ATP-binding protein [unclassified Bradyrhizobium]|uniref:dipeptide ABC transporter ATP-binding protein n=1 Tax=unclassified Bradyrhizobium TaxID=2631580 RepID=UPI002478B179|nr:MULTISPECIES: ABC transporter ATP-binding protein [unclassified Bradyrhizobium]WGR72831.1 ABC transporter ATP-binding protein [Bradyrhizobium sp. ISRA426]WGR77666.1 ABC transporter ATP-binding protein [Bradyrhizobium sp. ISRA430]WGR88071.1 ABC transporter ATP-binding protein [Bradyrhizobium sp. ISRA432]